eukprot:2582146-Rhodomonas_salina.1
MGLQENPLMLTSKSISQGTKARVSAEALPTPVRAKTGRREHLSRLSRGVGRQRLRRGERQSRGFAEARREET